MKFLFIINPISGNEDKSHLLKLVKAKLREKDEIEIFKTS